MLKLQFVDGSRESIWLVEPRLRIGTSSDNDLVLKYPEILDFHAEIRLQDDQLYLLNLKPENIVGVNGKKVNKAVKIGENDVIQLGKSKFKIIHPSAEFKTQKEAPLVQEHNEWGLQATASWASQSFYPIEDTVVIGRDESCDITVSVSHLSRRHAQLTVSGSYLVVKDLGSTNGTYLNGEKITQGRARPGDKLRFDVVNFTVTGPQVDVDQTIVRPGGAGMTAPVAAPSANKPKPAPKPEQAAKPATSPSPQENALRAELAGEESKPRRTNVVLYTLFGFFVVFGAISAYLLLQ